ncbi:hypothetical protein H696_00092 [Fonticula alba]|uniref:Uncharacterized protein n=1 Tax=Fonticula alba TaxID=691883 RepID=A0A058ZGA1_FONAL|nr:hypothetical protein H696_00092 [Fonticula alba]KCV72497.1 hypothetical protein H696_00092 [Fonticula alba]|eukprot:XP_009492198.1 hypothetical protein H696_00092 [Fonticula alba]
MSSSVPSSPLTTHQRRTERPHTILERPAGAGISRPPRPSLTSTIRTEPGQYGPGGRASGIALSPSERLRRLSVHLPRASLSGLKDFTTRRSQTIYDIDSDLYESPELVAERRARLRSMLDVPFRLEGFLGLAWLVCLHTTMSALLAAPMAAFRLLVSLPQGELTIQYAAAHLPAFLPIILPILVYRFRLLESSTLYHSTRAGQQSMKLFVVVNMLGVAARILAPIGADLGRTLSTAARKDHLPAVTPGASPSSSPQLAMPPHATGGTEAASTSHGVSPREVFYLAAAYTVVTALHAHVLLQELIVLNVAVNALDGGGALGALLMSTQFIEIKAYIFKKFNRGGIHELACTDAMERFHIAVYGAAIAFRNASELGLLDVLFSSPLSLSGWLAIFSYFAEALLKPYLMLALSELLVDAIKHACVSRRARLPSRLYSAFSGSLRVMLKSYRNTAIAARRIKFNPVPICSVVVFICIESIANPLSAHFGRTGVALIIGATFACLLLMRILLRILLTRLVRDAPKIDTPEAEALLRDCGDTDAEYL